MTYRGADQFGLRMPEGLREKVKATAKANHRSMNAEIVVAIEAAMQMTEGKVSKANSPSVIDQNGARQGSIPSNG